MTAGDIQEDWEANRSCSWETILWVLDPEPRPQNNLDRSGGPGPRPLMRSTYEALCHPAVTFLRYHRPRAPTWGPATRHPNKKSQRGESPGAEGFRDVFALPPPTPPPPPPFILVVSASRVHATLPSATASGWPATRWRCLSLKLISAMESCPIPAPAEQRLYRRKKWNGTRV